MWERCANDQIVRKNFTFVQDIKFDSDTQFVKLLRSQYREILEKVTTCIKSQ